jgi:hypothetical protein
LPKPKAARSPKPAADACIAAAVPSRNIKLNHKFSHKTWVAGGGKNSRFGSLTRQKIPAQGTSESIC